MPMADLPRTPGLVRIRSIRSGRSAAIPLAPSAGQPFLH
jgi:hypothetical protein